MTTGIKLKKTLGLEDFYEVWISRVIVQSTKPIYFVVYDSKRKKLPLPKNRFKDFPYVSMIYNGSDLNLDKYEVPTFTPMLKIERWGGNIQSGLFITVDLSYSKLLNKKSFDRIPESLEVLSIDHKGKTLTERVTIKDLLDKDSVDPHVDKFSKERKSIQGTENKLAKLLECNLDIANDTVTFIWLTESTTKKYPTNYGYKEVPIKKNYNKKSKRSILIPNRSKTYELHLQLLDILANIKELGIENEITKENMKVLIELSYVKLFSNDPSFLYTGIMYNATELDASIKPCNIKPTRWDKYRPNSVLSKHLRNLIQRGSIEFFMNQMASMLTKKLKDRGLI
jgi:hypothetical protein